MIQLVSRSPYKLILEIPGLPKMPNQLLRRHHFQIKKERDIWHSQIHLATTGRRPASPLMKAELICTRFSSQMPDYDGLCGGFKFPIDALVTCGILMDDNLDIIGVPEFYWNKAPTREGRIRIEVREVS